ncbi:MAG TPA: glucose-6-phosphate dehydrogenase assembly protein OpcA, partial [Thermoleophilaceae bacterium]
RDEPVVPARVLNLIAIVDREWRGEVLNRLEKVGRFHPSRTILCAVEPGRETIDAQVTLMTDDGEEDQVALTRERVVLDIGPSHLSALDSIVDPLVVSDIATLVWSPHRHREGVDALLKLSQVVLVDSVNEPDPAAALERAHDLAESVYVVDLAWLRSTPWRERVAATFDPPAWRDELRRISAVHVRHHPDSTAAGLLLFGWFASRLGWEPGSLIAVGDGHQGRAHGKRGDIELRLDPDPTLSVPGLAGIAVETTSGLSISLDRGPGGLSAKRRTRDGKEVDWTLLGASRGEAGILGEGIRQALLREPTYPPALAAAEAMLR